MPFKILSVEIDIFIGLLLLTFNLFMSKKFALDYANIIFRSNIKKNISKTGGEWTAKENKIRFKENWI